ncbi:MAG: hypothetical protein M0P61_06525 [Ignavibacteriaceae bacterium]|jgi:glycosyltransferase involved in cell wall biosynthesis|nr:hypothetical protein [Ignavibacteriaceae bacterium]
MKIVLLGRYSADDILTGPEKVAKRIFENLNRANIEVTFVDYFFKEKHSKKYLSRFFGKQIIQNSPLVLRLGIIRMIFFLIREKPNIIHLVTEERFMSFILFLKLFFKGKIITSLHGILRYEIEESEQRIRGRYKDLILERLVFHNSDVLIGLSDQQLKIAKRYYPSKEIAKAVKLSLGVDKVFFEPIHEKPFDSIKIVFYNGFNNFIDRGLNELIPILDESFLDLEAEVSLYIIGWFPKETFFNQKINIVKVDLMDSAKLAQFFRDKHFLVKGNKVDTFSQFVLEGMASGLVPIVSSSVGVAELIKNGEEGFVYNDYNELKNILRQKEFINRFLKTSKSAQNKVQQYKWVNVIELYINLYKNENEKN